MAQAEGEKVNPQNISPIKPRILSRIGHSGAQTVQSLAKYLPYGENSIYKVLTNLVDSGELVRTLERLPRGQGKYHYTIAARWQFPHIGAGEYLAYRPSGTIPLDCRRVE